MTARDFALLELDCRTLPNWPANAIRADRRPTGDVADSRDRALGERIFIGGVKNLLRLQHLLVHYSSRPLNKIDVVVQKIACVGLYQIGYLDQVPAAAAVDEAVKQAKQVGVASAGAFLNAVLRNAIRQPPPPDPTDPRRYAERVLSHPPELFDRIVQLVGGDVPRANRLCAHDNAEPPTIVRLFAGATVEQLAVPGVDLVPHERPGLYVARGAKQNVLADWAWRGLAQVQDPTAAAIADKCHVEPGMTVLDRCAGLGTKTLQLAERAGAAGVVYAVDPSVPRIEGLRHLAAARGVGNVRPITAAMLAESPEPVPASFDRVLVDAPCSNSGVLPRRPEARYAQNTKSLKSLRQLQLDILHDTAGQVAPGGLLVYSTCSIWPEENEAVADKFLTGHPEYERIEQAATLPSFETEEAVRYHDGGFYAVLRRR